MLTWSCERVQMELSAYHDDELPVADRIAVSDHLDTCPVCSLESSDLLSIRDALHASARQQINSMGRLNRLHTDVLERLSAEERASFPRVIRNLFDDPRRASASLGVSVFASLFLASGAFFLAQSPIRHPESLKAALTLSARARTTDVYLPAVVLPRVNAEAVMPATVANRDGDEVAFAALVRADGYLDELEFLGEWSLRRKHQTNEELSELLNAAATARFEPARVAGAPVSQNVVWVVSHTTVRAPLRGYVHVKVGGWKTL